MFECRHKSKFNSSWLGATEAPTLDKNKDIDFGWFLLEIITFISVLTSIIWQRIFEEEILETLDINLQLFFFKFL